MHDRAFVETLHAEFKRSRAEIGEAVTDALAQFPGLDLEPEQLALTPAVLPRASAYRIARDCDLVVRATQAAALELCPRVDQLARFVGLPDRERELRQFDRLATPSDWRLIARPDIALVRGAGVMLETNAIPCIALFPESDVLDRIYRSVPRIWDLVRQTSSIDTAAGFAAAVRSALPDAGRKLTALVDWRSDFREAPVLYEYMADALSRYGVPAVACCADDLEIEGDRILWEARPVDAVYRFFDTPGAIDPPLKHEQHDRLLRAVHAGKTDLVGHLGQRLLFAKSLLALVSEGAVGGHLVRRAQDFVPWTRILADTRTTFRDRSVELLSFVERHREQLVLKASLGRGGAGTTVGRDVSEVEWRASIQARVVAAEDWVVQEWVDAPAQELAFVVDGEVELRRCSVDYGLFLFEGAFAGGVRRNANSRTPRMTHVTRGAGVGQLRIR